MSHSGTADIYGWGYSGLLQLFFTNQWWDSLLNGRHAVLAGFGLSFLAAQFLVKHRLLAAVFITYLIAFSFPAVNLLKGDIPYLIEAEYSAKLPVDSLLIISHFAKPQVEAVFPGKLLAVNDPITSTSDIKHAIDLFLQSNRMVFVTAGALSEPYGLYSGPYLHNITLSYRHPFRFKELASLYTLQVYRTLSLADNLHFYRITSSVPSVYPFVPALNRSARLINSSDVVYQNLIAPFSLRYSLY